MTDPDAGPPIGADPALQHRAGRDTAAAGLIPDISMPRPGAGETSEGPLPAHRRHAVPTREHQGGGKPIHAAPTRPALPARGRDPPLALPQPLARFVGVNVVRPRCAAGAPR
jgi:hypothetical protein